MKFGDGSDKEIVRFKYSGSLGKSAAESLAIKEFGL
jgi:hypothetical protein